MSRTPEVEEALAMRGQCWASEILAAEVERLEAQLKGSMQAGGYEHFVEQLRNAQRQAHSAIYVAEQMEKKVEKLEALDELTTNQAKEYLARAEAAEARVKVLRAALEQLIETALIHDISPVELANAKAALTGASEARVQEPMARVKELEAALEGVETAHQRCTEIHHLLEPIYGSTNYAPIGSVLEKCLDDADAACDALQHIKAALADTKGTT